MLYDYIIYRDCIHNEYNIQIDAMLHDLIYETKLVQVFVYKDQIVSDEQGKVDIIFVGTSSSLQLRY